MQVFAFPSNEITLPEMNFSNFDFKEYERRQEACNELLKAHLVRMGYTGKYTGEVYRIPHADGHALYMVADQGRKMALVHLPYLDAWDSPFARRVTRKDVINSINYNVAMAAMFA